MFLALEDTLRLFVESNCFFDCVALVFLTSSLEEHPGYSSTRELLGLQSIFQIDFVIEPGIK